MFLAVHVEPIQTMYHDTH